MARCVGSECWCVLPGSTRRSKRGESDVPRQVLPVRAKGDCEASPGQPWRTTVATVLSGRQLHAHIEMACGVRRAGRHRRLAAGSTGMANQAGADDRQLPRRRIDGRDHPPLRRGAVAPPGPAFRGREPRWCVGRRRHGGGGARHPGRLHHPGFAECAAGTAAGAAQDAVCAHRPDPGRPDGRVRLWLRGAAEDRIQDAGRPGCLCQGQSRQAVVFLARLRLGHQSARRGVQAAGRHRHAARALSHRRRGADRLPGRHCRRHHRQRDVPACPSRAGHAAGRHLGPPLPDVPRHADDHAGRLQCRAADLRRDLRAQGDAGGDPGQAGARHRRGQRRSGGAAARVAGWLLPDDQDRPRAGRRTGRPGGRVPGLGDPHRVEDRIGTP